MILRRLATVNVFFIRALVLTAAFFFNSGVFAQEIEATFTVDTSAPARVSVEGKFTNSSAGAKNWAFLRGYADVSGLEQRVENLRLFDGAGKRLEIKKLADGEFLTAENAVSWKYEMQIELPNADAAAHVSWIKGDRGLLMPNDLLPQFGGGRARVKFELPAGWSVAGGENQIAEREFIVENAANAVFIVGRNWRERSAAVEGAVVNFVTAGDWQFSDDESLSMAGEILRQHLKIFGAIPGRRVRIFLLPFSQNSAGDDWRAETRGANLVLISAPIPLKSVALQRLHEQLRHELFHLWMPNALNLRGNYDWFYEGFTVYQALKTGVMLNQIRFQDFLDTLGQAFDLAKAGNANVSLIEAAQGRWRGAGSLIYAKGMLVAFLCDLAMLRESDGKRSLTNVFRALYSRHGFGGKREDGNAAILKLLNERAELRPLVSKYVTGGGKIDWAEGLTAIGVSVETAGGRSRLAIKEEPKGRQKDLLDDLGYNQWRKLIPKRK